MPAAVDNHIPALLLLRPAIAANSASNLTQGLGLFLHPKANTLMLLALGNATLFPADGKGPIILNIGSGPEVFSQCCANRASTPQSQIRITFTQGRLKRICAGCSLHAELNMFEQKRIRLPQPRVKHSGPLPH